MKFRVVSEFEPTGDQPQAIKQLADGKNVLHLDCSFVPVGRRSALIYPGGLAEMPAAIAEQYDLIEVTKAEQQILATNVLSYLWLTRGLQPANSS